MAWNNVYPITPSDPVVRFHWTRAIIQNKLYLYRQDQTKILRLNTSIPGAPVYDELTPLVSVGNPVNMAGVQGIFGAKGRLGLWDIENSIYWSNPDDVEDFQPQAETGANIVKIDAARGKIVLVLDTDDGFIVYTTTNIIYGIYDVDQIFRFEELTSRVGIFSPDHVCIGHNGEHIIYGNGDFYRINANRDPGRATIENIFPEVGDYIKKHKGYPRLSFHGNRYFAIALGDRDQDASTLIERTRIDGPGFYDEGYYREWKNRFLGWGYRFWLSNKDDLPEDYIPSESLAPDACPQITLDLPLPDYHPIDYTAPIATGEQDIPNRGYEGKYLWYMKLESRPGIDLESISDSGFKILFDGATPGQTQQLYATATSYNAIGITADTFQDYRSYWNNTNWNFGSARRTFSFNPFRLISMQMEKYKDRHRTFYNGANNFGDYNLDVEGYSYDKVSESGLSSIILGAATGEAPIYNPSVTDVDEDLTISNIRERDKDGNRVRETKTWQFTRTIVHIFNNVAKNDWELLSTGTEPVQPNAMEGLSRVWDTRVEDDTFFLNNACIGSDEFMRNRVGELGNPYPFSASPIPTPTSDRELFGTQALISGQTDFTNFATIGSFAARRAFVESHNISVKTYERHELKEIDPLDPAQGYYYLEHKIEASDTRTFDRLVLESLTPSPDGYSDLGLTTVPRRNQNAAWPIYFIFNNDNEDPELKLQEYWTEALTKYPAMQDYLAIKQVYEDNGWTVLNHVPGVSVNDSHFTLPTANKSPDTFNNTPNSGVFTEIDLLGSLCGEVLSTVPVVNFDGDITDYNTTIQGRIPTVVERDGFSLEEWEVTGAPLVELTGQAGVLDNYPTYFTTLWFDWFLKKWGICTNPVRFNMDYRPSNRISYDPMSGTSISEYTYQNFLKSLGAMGLNGELIVWDRNPSWSFAVFGKAGYKRRLTTRMIEANFEFLDKPNCLVGVESAITPDGLNPYMTVAKLTKKSFERLLLDNAGAYHNIFIIGGRYEIIQFEYVGHPAGEY